MCTAINIRAKDGSVVVARTMDFSYPLNPEHVRYESGELWKSSINPEKFRVRYGFEGIGQSVYGDEKAVIIADGVNENGLCVAALYFPGFARYDENLSGKSVVVAAYEAVPYILGTCKDAEHAVSVMGNIKIAGVPDGITGIVAPLHWIISDRYGSCITAEKTGLGFHFYDNTIGVLTNSPDFGWHMRNLRNYAGLSVKRSEGKQWGKVEISPFGQGDGMMGIPGDYTPPSRFVKTAWLKTHTTPGKNYDEIFRYARCILGNVTIPQGCVVTERGNVDYTQYTVYFNLTSPGVIFERM